MNMDRQVGQDWKLTFAKHAGERKGRGGGLGFEEGEEEFAVVEAGLSRLLLFLHCKERMAHR